MPTPPSRLRLAAALITSATATLLLVQLLGVSHAEQPPVAAAPPAPVQIARAERPSEPLQGVDTVLPPPPPAQKKTSKLRKVMPVSHFGGY